jgi:hypothetical protein
VDFLRFVAALLAVLFHYCFRGCSAGNYWTVAFPEIADVAKYGDLRVDLFFMISGFVIVASARGRSAAAFSWPVPVASMSPSGRADSHRGGGGGRALGRRAALGAVDGVYWSLIVEPHF